MKSFKFFKKVGGVSIIVFLSSICFFIANIFLGRILPTEDYGYFQFIRTVTFIVPAIVILGMDVSLIRYFSKLDISEFDWLRNIVISARNMSLVTIPVILFLIFYYKINISNSIIIYFIILIYGFLLMCNSILRVNSQYFKAQILTSGWRIVFLLFIFIIYILHYFNLHSIVIFYFMAFFIFLILSLFFIKKLPKGSIKVSNKIVFQRGFFFYLITISGLLMTQLDRFFISKILGFEELGVYVAVSVIIITVYNLLGTSIGYVLMPYLAKGRRINKKILFIFIPIITFILSVLFLLFTRDMNHIFYNGRYDGHQNLIFLFIIIGILQFLYNFIYFALGGMGHKDDFKKFLISILLSIIIFVFLSMILISKFGLLGAAIATAASWVIRDLGGLIILKGKRIHA